MGSAVVTAVGVGIAVAIQVAVVGQASKFRHVLGIAVLVGGVVLISARS